MSSGQWMAPWEKVVFSACRSDLWKGWVSFIFQDAAASVEVASLEVLVHLAEWWCQNQQWRYTVITFYSGYSVLFLLKTYTLIIFSILNFHMCSYTTAS